MLGTPTHPAPAGCRFHACDVTRKEQVERLFQELRPTHVYHLAGPSHVGDSFSHAAETVVAIAAGAIEVLSAAVRLDPQPRVLLVSSAEVYGASGAAGPPLSEDFALDPESPYGVGKLAAEAFARQLARRGLPVVIARSFNHLGPRQSDRFVCSSIARQIAEAEAGIGRPQIAIGSLSPERDFTDVRDVARAYALLIDRGEPGGAYNVASGRALSISELSERLIGLSRVPIELRRSPARERQGESRRRVGDASRLRAEGWAPTVPLGQTLRDALDDWRMHYKGARGGAAGLSGGGP